jgi:hypothetical protein
MLSIPSGKAFTLSDFPSHQLRQLNTRRPLLPDFIRLVLKHQLDGSPARFTDGYLATKLGCCAETIANLRAWCEQHVGLRSVFRGWRGHGYEFDLPVLAQAVADAVEAAMERMEKWRRNCQEALERGTQEALRSSQDKASLDQSRKLPEPKLRDFQANTEQNSINCFLEQGQGTGKANSALCEDHISSLKGPDCSASGPDSTLAAVSASLNGPEALPPTTSQTADLPPAAAPPLAPQTALWRHWLECAKQLVSSCGERWNPNLQRLCEGLDGEHLRRAVMALWEQVLKGNVRKAPAWLTRALKYHFGPSKAFVPPTWMPEVRPAPVAEPWQSVATLGQSPYAQQAWYQSYVRQFGQQPRIEDSADGPALLHNGRLTPVSWLATGG